MPHLVKLPSERSASIFNKASIYKNFDIDLNSQGTIKFQIKMYMDNVNSLSLNLKQISSSTYGNNLAGASVNSKISIF